jgi:hypothetical protein
MALTEKRKQGGSAWLISSGIVSAGKNHLL